MENDSFEITPISALSALNSISRPGLNAYSASLPGQNRIAQVIPNVGNSLPPVLVAREPGTVEISSTGRASSSLTSVDPYKDTEDLYKRMSDYTKQTSSYQRSITNIENTAKILDVEMPETVFSMRNPNHLANPVALIHESSKLHTQFSLFNTLVGGLTKGINKLLSATS